MRTVIGRRLTEVDVGYLAQRIARSDRLVIDLGIGDGRAVMARARAEPGAFVIGSGG
jgi:tRNA G46 methylase TrmB